MGAETLEAEAKPHRRHRISLLLGGVAALLVGAIFATSIYIDPIIRVRVESAMNQKLIGYHGVVAGAHLRLLDGALILHGVSIVQSAHPNPPVADIAKLEVRIQWSELFEGLIVADAVIQDPRVHIDLTQLRSERASKVPLSKKGWQDALQAIYPFKINRFRVINGTFAYIDVDPQRPLELTDLSLAANNVRNIRAGGDTYPSPIHLDATVFGQGHITLDGKANFLAKPFAAVSARYWLTGIRLSQFATEIQRANMNIRGGQIESDGLLEYAPWGQRAEVYEATIDGVELDYVHRARTAAAEAKRATEVKQAAEQVNNRKGLLLKIDEVNFVRSKFTFSDEAENPPFNLLVSDLTLKATDVSNHSNQGNSGIAMRGKFMNSGSLVMTGVFRPERSGPDFSINLAVQNTDLVSLNDLLEAYGGVRVAHGKFSVFSQMTVKGGNIDGYVKPLFTGLAVYDYQRDKNKPLTQQAYKLLVAAGAHLLKNGHTESVATNVQIAGKLSQPDVNVWQALGQALENGFIKAIMPGFDRSVKTQATIH